MPREGRSFPNSGLRWLIGLSALTMYGCGSSPQVYVGRGNHFFDIGKYEDAAIQYQKALQKDPKLGEAHYRLGLVDLKRNQPGPAYPELQRAAALMPGNDEVLARFGVLALSLYNADPRRPKQLYDQAAKAAEQLLHNNPASFEGNRLKGALALIDRKPADALGYLQKAVQAKPSDADAQLGLARALAEDNQAAAGMNLAMELIRKDKTFGAGYDFLFQQYQASGKTADAENILKLKVSNNPKQAAFLLELARYYAASKKPSEVNATVQKLVDDPADFPDGRLLAGDFYGSVGRPQEALQQYQAGLQARPKDPAIYQKRLVSILAAQRKWLEALQQLNVILKDKPGDQDSKLNRALIWLDEGKSENLDPAIAELRAQIAKKPQDATLHFQLGSALARKNDQDSARREWSTAARQNNGYLPPRFALAEMDLAQGKTQDAMQLADQIVALAPRDGRARLLYAACLTSAGQYKRARTELNQLAAQAPQLPQIQFRLGVLAIAEHKYKEAEDIFRKLETTAAGDPQVLAGLAEAYKGENESAKAIQALEDEVKRSPNSPQLRQILARFAAASGKYDIAVDQYKQLAAAAPRSGDLQISLAAAYNASGDHKTAIEVLEKAAQADPKSATTELDLARTLLAAGRVSDAKAGYRKVLAIQPNNATALNDLAWLMADSGENLGEALSFAQRGLQTAVDPGLKNALSDTLGWVYLKKNSPDAALQVFQNLVRGNPDNPTYRYHLGAALLQKGDKRKARTELDAALAAKPDASDEPKIRELLGRL
jgi:tetratricopeptide (TPR) repeat protein